LDEFGGEHTFTFNQNHRISYFTNGWFALLTQYQIAQAKEITFAFYGNSTFHIHVGRVLATTDDYPSFHSYSTQPIVTTHFDVVLSQYTANSSQLVVRLTQKFNLHILHIPNQKSLLTYNVFF
jgi:hypothetical protein